MKSYKIHLVRHGSTDANTRGLYVGRTDFPLSPEGLGELLALKKEGGYPPAGRFFTSPLSRCRQTLEVLYPGCRQEVVEGFAECDFGEWDGRSAEELKSLPAFQEWIAGRLPAPPGGEDAATFQGRVTHAFETVVEQLMRSGETEAVICTHAGVVMMLMAAYALPRAEMQDWAVASGRGYTLRVTPTLWMREPVAEAVCCIPKTHGENTDN